MHTYTCNDLQLAGKSDEMKIKMKMTVKNERGRSDGVFFFRVCVGSVGSAGSVSFTFLQRVSE